MLTSTNLFIDAMASDLNGLTPEQTLMLNTEFARATDKNTRLNCCMATEPEENPQLTCRGLCNCVSRIQSEIDEPQIQTPMNDTRYVPCKANNFDRAECLKTQCAKIEGNFCIHRFK